MKYLLAVLMIIVGIAPALAQEDGTLADALQENSIPPASIPRLNSPITSFSTLNTHEEFVIAYYLANDKKELRWPVYVAKLDKNSGQWKSVELANVQFVSSLAGRSDSGRKSDCLGSVLGIKKNAQRYFLDLHLTPSASCLLILHSDLTIDNTLSGWDVGFLANRMLWIRNMVHFASTHPEELWMYDLQTRSSKELYPPSGDPLRKSYQERLARVIDDKQCHENNWTCDPKLFTSEIDQVTTDQQDGAFAFRVSFSPDGFLTREQAENSGSWDDDKYVYIYRLKPFAWRAFSIYDLKRKFGTDSLLQLLTPEKLRQVFATPAPSFQ